MRGGMNTKAIKSNNSFLFLSQETIAIRKNNPRLKFIIGVLWKNDSERIRRNIPLKLLEHPYLPSQKK